MPQRPLVSVVIPTHNRAPLVASAIESVLAQTMSDFELIVVDDHSSDDTAAVVGGHSDHRVRYMRRPTCGGGSAARNTGIRASNGTYIAFLDDDDEWMPEKLSRQLAALGDYDAILCNVRLKSNGAVVRRYRKTVIEPKDLRRGFTFGGGTSTFLIMANAMKEVLFDESLPCYQDWDALLRLSTRYKVRYLDQPLVVFNNGRHPRISNVSGSPLDGADEERLRPVIKHRDFLGAFWFRYHIAKQMLSHNKKRRHRLTHLVETARQCGVVAMSLVCYHHLEFRLQQRFRANQ